MIANSINKNHKEFILNFGSNIKIFLSKFGELITSNIKEAKSLLYEITRETVHKEYQLDNYFLIVETLFKDFNNFFSNTIIEVFWLIGFILEKRSDGNIEFPESLQIYATIINTLIKKKIVSLNVLIERLEESSLFECGLIQDKKTFKTKLTRINTKITYEQQKYNLLREDSEGFAKLIFLLLEVKITDDNLNYYIDKILCLIGFFDLDPNRVLDLILTSFEKDCYNLNFLEIIKLFNENALSQILGFKFVAGLENKENIKKKNIDLGLYIVTAQLIKFNLLKLEDILPHFTPTLKEIEKKFKSKIDNTVEIYKSLHQRVSKELSTSAPTTSTSDTLTRSSNYFVNFSDITSETYKECYTTTNQLLLLLEAMVKVRASDHCEIIYSLIEDVYDPLECLSLVKTLTETLSWMIEPLYEDLSNKKIFRDIKTESNKKDKEPSNIIIQEKTIALFGQIVSSEEFLLKSNRLLKYLTLGLSTDQILFSKILRIIKYNSKSYFESPLSIKIVTDLLCKVFLPSVSLIDPTPSLVNDLWSVLSKFDYLKRYKIYNFWLNNVYNTHPALYLKYGVVVKEADKWQKTLSKENQRAHGRTLGILTNANPIIVFDNVLKLITAYDNQINVFMQSLSFCSSLSYDVITYIICKTLADPSRDKLNIINGDMSSWFKFFAYFIGHFFKKFHIAEFSGILYYLGTRLKSSATLVEMYVLKEMIEKMSGIVVMEELNESQICAGGLYLYLESRDLVKEYKNLKKPTQSLLKFFLNNGLPDFLTVNGNSNIADNPVNPEYTSADNHNPNHDEIIDINCEFKEKHGMLSYTSILLILLATRRQKIIFNSNFKQSKLIGYLYDQIHNIFIQLVQFLSMFTNRDEYSTFLPKWSLDKYVINYNCQPETVFFIIRHKLKPLYDMDSKEYGDYINQFQNVLNTYQALNKKTFIEGFESTYIEKESFLDDLYKEIWKFITPELFFIFSALQLKDIYVPITNYEKEIDKNRKEVERLTEDAKTYSDINKNKKEIEKLKNSIENLENEMNSNKKNYEKIVKFLEEKKTSLIDDNSIPKPNRCQISRFLIQYCLYPRLIFSKVEAFYVAKMMVLLIDLKIQNINVFDIWQRMIKYLLPCIFCLTEFESQNLGIFLLEFLKEVKIWQDEAIWKNQCVTNPAFSRNLDTPIPVDLLEFKKAYICLLSKMNSTFLTIFSGENYMSCRNAIIVLNSINSVYPPIKEIAQELTDSLDKAVEKFKIANEKYKTYEDLTMMMGRYRDILVIKKTSLPYEKEITGEKPKDKSPSKPGNVNKKPKKKDKSKERRREENSRTPPDIKKRNELEDYKTDKNRK